MLWWISLLAVAAFVGIVALMQAWPSIQRWKWDHPDEFWSTAEGQAACRVCVKYDTFAPHLPVQTQRRREEAEEHRRRASRIDVHERSRLSISTKERIA